MSTDSKIWFWAHLGVSILVAAIVATSFVLLFANSSLLIGTINAAIILLFVMPGALLVFAINHLILWRRKPRVIRVADKVVIVIVAVLTAVTFISAFSEEPGIWIGLFSVPLLIIAGIASTIVIAIGNSSVAVTPLQVAPAEPVASTPVAATLDELFTESAAPAPAAAEPAAGETPYGPKP